MSKRIQFTYLISIGVCTILSGKGFTQTQEVFIEGVIRERRDVNRPGQSVVISPSGETRFDSQNYLKSDPSLQISGTGRTSGFSLPLFRGQDARSSHVFVDDIELQDPFSGLPMIDDIDLRAFGSMSIHKGVSPWNVPVLEPGGVLQFSLRRPVAPYQAGVSHGDVTGTSGWFRSSTSIENKANFGTYARRAQSNGRYRYYSDNNTVLNPSDDVIVLRGNNDFSSLQGLGNAAWVGSQMSFRGLIWGQDSERGISLGEKNGDGRARSNANTKVLMTALRRDWSDRFWSGFDIGGFAGTRLLKDPDQNIGFASRRRLMSQSLRTRLLGGYDSSELSIITSAERLDSRTDLSSTYENDFYSPTAAGYKLFLGARVKLLESETLEFKVGSQWLTSITTTSQGDKSQKSGGKGNLGGSVAWSHFMNDFLVYGQIAKASRSPSLLERIGDGAQIEGAPTLAPEDSLALESGARYIFTLPAELRALLGLTWWSRDNNEVIRIDRVSPVRWRARNYGQQKFRGLELRSDLGSDLVGIEAALSWMRASQADSSLLVPKMPMWQSAVGTRWQILERLIFRSMSQYVGRMYHDASNTRELMWTLTHDVSLDYSDAAGVWKVGVSVTNVTNVMSNKIRDTLTDSDQGRIAFSQYNGEPLPGRSLLISVSAGI